MPIFRLLCTSAVFSSLILIGCAQPNGIPMITFMKNSQPLSGKWYGQATCSNNEVSKLTLDIIGTASGKLSGTLAIAQSNNRSGLYSFNGQFEQGATLRVTPAQWLQKTGNPSSFPLTGKADDVNQPTVIRGAMPECGGTFELGRTQQNVNVVEKVKFAPVSAKNTLATIGTPEFVSSVIGKQFNVHTQTALPGESESILIMPKLGFTAVQREGKQGFPSSGIFDIGLETYDEYAPFTRFHYEIGKLNNDYWVLIYSNEWAYSTRWKNKQPNLTGTVTDLIKIGPFDMEHSRFWPIAYMDGSYINEQLIGVPSINGKHCEGECNIFAVLPTPIKLPKKKNSSFDAAYLWKANMLSGRTWKLSQQGKLSPITLKSFQVVEEVEDAD